MRTVPLNESASCVFSGAGSGRLKMVPHGGGETWLPTVVSVKASSNISEANCRIYIGSLPTDNNFIDATLSGSTGDSTDRVSGYSVDTHGNSLWALWFGGDPGATGTMVVNGTETIP